MVVSKRNTLRFEIRFGDDKINEKPKINDLGNVMSAENVMQKSESQLEQRKLPPLTAENKRRESIVRNNEDYY